ncbi:ArsR family transcriptional regulator [Aliishimia ponticola]|uniref:ArsR family transcriptional regulator n=1 Tax=Aliishimia ponticola TaxID=2499833 RepID=A0A4S4NIS0_9RHOB|nr:helix-turn-helix domain-containing protein [Aliishimia ponticola]THH38118.1 ArsR family transcriptional regulator [Aliishimia ponticola]
MEIEVSNRLSILGHPTRLAIFRLLVRRYPHRMPAGEIASVLGLKASTLSSYLSTLMQSGLVTQKRVGTSLRYSTDMIEVYDTFDYLFRDCCRGRADLCPPVMQTLLTGDDPMTDTALKVLFICTGNSARSLFAEAILRKEGGDRFDVYSAGVRPGDAPNPFALELLESKGYDVSPLRSKSIEEYQGDGAPVFDFVFTVCDQAANEECPAWPGQPISGHWGVPDPVKAEGTDAQKMLAFQQAYGLLRNRILAFSALSLAELDRMSLQKAVDDIAFIGAEENA